MVKFTIVIFLLLAFKMWWDTRAKDKYKRVINHTKSSIIDILLYTLSSILIFDKWYVILGYIILGLSIRWIFFDPIFSKINWGVWDFHGTSSTIDRFLTRLGKYHFFIKLVPVLIAIIFIKLEFVIKITIQLWEIIKNFL